MVSLWAWLAKKGSLLTILTVSLIPFSAYSQAPSKMALLSLQDDPSIQNVIRTALMKNSKIKANDLRVAAAAYQIEAAKMALWPSFNLGYSFTDSGNRTSTDRETWIRNSTSHRGPRASISLNLFRGFADYYAIKAAKCRYQELKATYESTDSFIKNTRGEHASSVVRVFMSLVQLRSAQKFQKEMDVILNKLLNATSNEGKGLIESRLQELKLSELQVSQSLKMIEKNFKYLVREDAPASTPSLEQIIDSIELPASAREALPIALQKSPEIISARLGVECLKYNYKSAKGRMTSPSVDLTASAGSRSSGHSKSASTDLMLTISWSFQPSTIPELKAMETQIQALEEDRKSAIEDIEYELEQMYPQMIDAFAVIQAQLKQYENAQAKMEEIMAAIQQGQVLSGDSLNSAISVLQTMSSSWNSLYGNQQQGYGLLISTKFSIQKSIGTLFESLEESAQLSDPQIQAFKGTKSESKPELGSDIVIKYGPKN